MIIRGLCIENLPCLGGGGARNSGWRLMFTDFGKTESSVTLAPRVSSNLVA